MSVFLSRIPLRESRGFVVVCAVVFAVFLAVLLGWPRALKEERVIAKKQNEVSEMKARGEPVPTSAYPKVEHHVAVWLRKGWALNTIIAGALLLASPWLGRRRGGEISFLPASQTLTGKGRLGTAIFCVALMGFAAWQNYPRLFLSMWGDEEFNASRFIVDEVTRQDDGSIEIKPRPWTATLWSFRKTTNHPGFSALARLSHDTFFVKKTGPADPFFSEALIRLPVYVAGLLFIPALFWVGRVWGISMWFGVIIAVLHPWFLRFGVDGRAYGFVLLGVPVMLALLGRGLQTGRWHWWLLLGFTEFFVVWSYFGSVYLLVTLNLAALGLIFTGTGDKQARWLLLSRWLVSGVFAKMLIIGMMTPCWPQLLEFLDQKPISGALNWPWWRDSFSELFFGAPWADATPGNPRGVAMTHHWHGLLVGPWIIASILTVAGMVRLSCSRRVRWLLVVALGAPALMITHMAHGGIQPYAWYLVPYLPGLVLVLSSGAGALTGGAGRRGGVWLSVIFTHLAITAFIAAYVWPWMAYRSYPIEQSRESVALYRTVTNPRNPDIDKDVISGGFVMYTEGYDPALHRFKNVAGLRALMEEADRTGKKLFINVGHIEYARDFGFADICKIIEDPAQFEHVRTLHGLFFSTTREVYRWHGRQGVNGQGVTK